MRIVIIATFFLTLGCKHDSSLKTEAKPDVANVEAQVPIVAKEQQAGQEEFTKINATILNSRLAMEERKMEVKDVAKLLFIPSQSNSDESNISLEQRKLENGNIEAIIIHENSPNNAVSAEKFVMILQQKDDVWQIVSLKKNWRCKEERTYQIWGIGSC